jgi:UDP-glucose 4-epimerase
MIMVTGGAGYVGSHVVKALIPLGYEIIVLDNLSTGYKAAVDKRALFIQGDLKDENILNLIFSTCPIKGVMHFAASCYVGESVVNPIKYYQNNVASSICLFGTMLKYKVSKLVFSSTCAVYGIPYAEKIDETCCPDPINPYGRSKLMIEQIMEDLSSTYDFNFICLRYFNAAGADPTGTIGEHHNPETHLIPNIIYHLLGKRDNITVYGDDYPTNDGTCIRDYIHVNDLANAHILALQSLITGKDHKEYYNVGNDRGYSVKEVIEMCEKISGKKANIIYKSRRKGDPPKLISSSSKIFKALGWKPCYSIQEIIETAWKWHSSYPDEETKNLPCERGY